METPSALIHKLHVEIIRSIFEYAVHPTDINRNPGSFSIPEKLSSSFASAILLSRICRHWRFIALDTPRIWVYIGLDLCKRQDFINSYWETALERVRSAPLVIYISFPAPSTCQSIPRNFSRMQCIDELTLHFAMRDDFFTVLLDDNFPFPQCPIRKLVLSIGGGTWHEPRVFNLNEILSKWPPISWIRTSGDLSWAHLDATFPLPRTTHLCIGRLAYFSLNTLNTAFPALQSMKFVDMHLPVVLKVEIFKSLTQMTRTRPDSNIVSSHMKCPNLTTLNIETKIEEKHLFDFISSHKTIRTLTLPYGFSLAAIATSAPQLHTLSVDDSNHIHILYNWETAGLSSLLFPELQNLNIRSQHAKVGLEEFESIVSCRFLSSQNPQSRLLPGIQHRMRSLILKYIVSDSSTSRSYAVPEWKSSPLLQYAKIADYHSRIDYHEVCSTMLEWPDILDS